MGSGAVWKGVVRVVFCCPGSGLVFGFSAHGRPGGDRLSRALRRSTIGAEGFHGRVRDGIGWGPLDVATRPSMGSQMTEIRGQRSEIRDQMSEFLISDLCPLISAPVDRKSTRLNSSH